MPFKATNLAEMRTMLNVLGIHTQAPPSFDMSKFPLFQLPRGFKYPQTLKFDGTTNPHSHIVKFQMKSTPYCHDLGLHIHLFFYSLEGEPMDWFLTLSGDNLNSFNKIRECFLTKYQHKIVSKPTFHDLSRESMKPGEEWVTFANRWRDMATRSSLDIPERQVVQTLVANTTGPMKRGLANAYCPSITALYEVAASVKENVHEF